MPTKFHSVLLINIVVLILGNAIIYFGLTSYSEMEIIMIAITFTVIHLFIAITTGIFYRSLLDISPQGRGWFWSAIIIAVLGMLYYALLTVYS